MLIAGVHGGVDAKVDTNAVSHDCLAIECLPDGDGVGDVEKGHDNALKGLQGRPCVDFCVRVDGLSDFCKGGGVEDLWRKEVLKVC